MRSKVNAGDPHGLQALVLGEHLVALHLLMLACHYSLHDMQNLSQAAVGQRCCALLARGLAGLQVLVGRVALHLAEAHGLQRRGCRSLRKLCTICGVSASLSDAAPPFKMPPSQANPSFASGTMLQSLSKCFFQLYSNLCPELRLVCSLWHLQHLAANFCRQHIPRLRGFWAHLRRVIETLLSPKVSTTDSFNIARIPRSKVYSFHEGSSLTVKSHQRQ